MLLIDDEPRRLPRPIAKTRAPLSPLDLDEINVCETLSQGLGAAVPPAGVVEVVLSPTGGAYGWVKNFSGRFFRGIPEPYAPEHRVVAIGKTDCRLVGPNVTTAHKVQGINAPILSPVLIEKTGDERPCAESDFPQCAGPCPRLDQTCVATAASNQCQCVGPPED